MIHNQESDWASSELARVILTNPETCFRQAPKNNNLSIYASHEGTFNWPHADGVVVIEQTVSGKTKTFNVAVEYKRHNEGLHGILTAIGQASAYLHKGYSGSAIVIPSNYSNLENAGTYLSQVIASTSSRKNLGIFTYSGLDVSLPSPFLNRINLVRRLEIDDSPAEKNLIQVKSKQQWAHLREGSSDPDSFFKYLISVKHTSKENAEEPKVNLPKMLVRAIKALNKDYDPIFFLSYTSGNKFSELAWRNFWFNYVLHSSMLYGWHKNGARYVVNNVLTKLNRSDGKGFKQMFSGRTDSIKNVLVDRMNSGSISELEAWKELAINFKNRAHSFREDIDSGLEGIGFLEAGGQLSEAGFSFLNACERNGNANIGKPRLLLTKALLNEGKLITFLHYVYRLSDEVFKNNSLAFLKNDKGNSTFDQASYLNYLRDKMVNDIHAIKKSSDRGGTKRVPFQAELAILRSFDIVGNFRPGLGLEINWPSILELS